MTYYDSEKYPYFKKNFLSEKDCDMIVQYMEDNPNFYDDDQSQSNEFWSKRVVNAKQIPDESIKNLLLKTNKKVNDIVVDMLENPRIMVTDTIQVVRWFKGYELKPHADKENPNDSPHPFPWRDFASVVYLNDNFEGGEIHFPNQGKQFKPKKGALIVFPGTYEFLHGVKEVTEGIRYTLPSFHTFDLKHGVVI